MTDQLRPFAAGWRDHVCGDMVRPFLAQLDADLRRTARAPLKVLAPLHIGMTLSVDQRRILANLAQGYKLLILRSPLDGRVVGATLWEPDRNTVESIALWRVERLVSVGALRQDTHASSPALEWVVTSPAVPPKRRATRRSDTEAAAVVAAAALFAATQSALGKRSGTVGSAC